MLKSSILIAALLMTGCTVNGKSLNEMMGKKENSSKKESSSNLDKLTPDAPKVTKSEKSSSKIHFKWANKEYHDGNEEIGFTVNKKD
jgi:hypothetical protein